jgi:very-short-patch-repair endonuclease
MAQSALEFEAEMTMRAAGLPTPVKELVFAKPRRFRFDFAWPEHMVALEVDGGTRGGTGRHSRGAGYDADCEKSYLAIKAGWRVIHVTGTHIRAGRMVEWLEHLLA